MNLSHKKIHIGPRTAKTVAAVILSMVAVDALGATTSKLIFAMLGAMAAVQPTFQDSLESCITQIVGVISGAVIGVLLRLLNLPPLVATGIGLMITIAFYNAFLIQYSPGLPCFIVVMVCTTPDVNPIDYAAGRIWDTAIGLGIGMVMNTLILPYDNSRQIRATAESLDKEVLAFLEELFDGDSIMPDSDAISRRIRTMEKQLKLYSRQKLVLHLRRQKALLERFRLWETMAKQLVAHMEVLCRMGKPGILSSENRELLTQTGANIRDSRISDNETPEDIVTNYHVSRILSLRRQLLDELKK